MKGPYANLISCKFQNVSLHTILSVLQVDGIVPNEYESPLVPLGKLFSLSYQRIYHFLHDSHRQLLGKRIKNEDAKAD